MQADIYAYGPWKEVNDDELRETFIDFMRQSSHPEDFEGIASGVKPPADRGFRIIKKSVSVDPMKRDGTFAPCNLCGPAPKFKNDGMLIADEYGWLYLIGPICGEQHYAGRFRDEERRFDREQAERAAQGFLLSELPQILNWRREADNLLPFVQAASVAHKRLVKATKVVTHLRRALTKQDGWLRVAEERQVLQANGGYRTEHHEVGISRIKGGAAVRSSCSVVERYEHTLSVFEMFGADEESAFDVIADAETEGRLSDIAISLRGAVAALGEVRREIKEFQEFFSAENYRAIAAWASDPRCPIEFTVEATRTSRTLEVARAHKRFPVEVTALLRPLPN